MNVHLLNGSVLDLTNLGDPPTVEKFSTEGTTKISFQMGEKVSFCCEAKGTPPLEYIWTCNTKEINRRLSYNKLTIKAEEETEGEYQCSVKNAFGLTPSEVIRIKVGESNFDEKLQL